MKTNGMALLALLGLAFGARAQDAAPRVGPASPGIDVGEKAPRFTLKDQSGQERSLDELLAGGKVALVFFRSADW